MNALISMLIEAALRSAIEAHAMQAKLDAEGRTELSPEEEAKLREATDLAAQVARMKGERL